MEQLAINGKIVSEPKVLKLSPLLIYVKVENGTGKSVNCIVHQHGLNFLYQAADGLRVAMYGHYNRRNQFVVGKFTIMATTAQEAS